jgi:hypothetical protein
VSAKPSAACGRNSEAQHGQSKEKASNCAAFDYGLPPAEEKAAQKEKLKGVIHFLP